VELSKVEVSDTDSIADGFFDEIASEHSAKPEKLTDTVSSFRRTESDTTDNAGQVYQRLSLAEAAVHFGVSERTIQRRIAKEALRSEKDDQGKVFVFCPTLSDTIYVSDNISPTEQTEFFEKPGGSETGHTESDTVRQVDTGFVRHLMDKLEAATYRNGYLEAQLAQKETEIKLLTDSSRRSGWWHRFSAWFVGQRNDYP
jgi:hypothetical protein